MMMLVAFIAFMIFLFMGVPIAFSMGLGSLLGLLVSGNPLSVVGQRLFYQLLQPDGHSLLHAVR